MCNITAFLSLGNSKWWCFVLVLVFLYFAFWKLCSEIARSSFSSFHWRKTLGLDSRFWKLAMKALLDLGVLFTIASKLFNDKEYQFSDMRSIWNNKMAWLFCLCSKKFWKINQRVAFGCQNISFVFFLKRQVREYGVWEPNGLA